MAITSMTHSEHVFLDWKPTYLSAYVSSNPIMLLIFGVRHRAIIWPYLCGFASPLMAGGISRPLIVFDVSGRLRSDILPALTDGACAPVMVKLHSGHLQ
jgi:hypothetical protein